MPNTVWQAGSVQRVHADPFGATRAGSGTVPGDHRFLGAVRDATGLTLLGARYYDEYAGVFVSVDPMLQAGVPAQFNAYVYSGNNPVTFSDPTGLWWGELWGAVSNAAKQVGSFVNTYKAEIVGAVVSIGVGIACTAATGGVGVIGCAIAAGAAGSAVTSLMKSAETGTFSLGQFALDVAIGGVSGLAGLGVGKVLTSLVKPGISSAASAVSNAIRGSTQTVVSTGQRVTSAVASAASRASTAIATAASKTITAVANGAKTVIGAAKNSINTIKGLFKPKATTGASATKAPNEGIVYLRSDLNGGKPYVGQAKSDTRFNLRQSEHARANPDADFEFEILGRAKPGAELDRLEEFFIRLGGGPTNRANPNGGLANLRHQMSDLRYWAAGGDLW